MATIPKYCDTPEKVEEWKAKRRAYNKARDQTPEHKARVKAYQQSQKYKAYQKARNQTPEFKAHRKAWHKARDKTPERKAAQKSYSNAHYQNLRKEQSTADAFRMMQAASELAKALANL